MEALKIKQLMTKEVISVGPDCLLKQAVGMMGEQKISFLIIAKDNKPIGVLSERDIVRLASEHINPEQVAIRDVMTSPVISVTEDANIFQVYDLLNTKKIRHMVVVDDAGQIAGLATLTNILGGLSIEYFVELKQVTNIMSQNICTLNMDDRVQQAVDLMAEKRISCIIIIHENKPVGIITERDIMRLYSVGMAEDIAVESIMSSPVRVVHSGAFIPEANAIMREEKLRHLVIENADGSLAGLISQSDIARRIEEHYIGYLRGMLKQQGQKLQYEHDRFAILFEQNPNAVISLDIDGNIIDINQACMRLIGYGQKEVVGKPLESFVHPEDVSNARNSFNKASEHKTGLGEFRILRKSGKVIHVFNNYLPIYADNSLYRIYSIMHDVSNVKQAQQQIRVAEEKAQLLSQAVEQAGDSVIITDSQGTIEFVNAAFTRITGYTSKEAVGNKPSILKSGEQDQAFYEQMWGRITKGEAWQSRLVDRRKNGEFYPAELSISPVFNAEGEITHFIGIKRDLTEREELEEKFHQAQKMEALGTLVGGIAHDFNNMLAGMTGNLYLAKKRVEHMPEVMKKLTNVERLSLRAADMIRQLLTFARKDHVSMKQIPLNTFIKETLRLFRSSVPENISIRCNICKDTLLINGDATQLHQVLMNLVTNACDAVEEAREPFVTIRLEAFEPDDAFIASHTYFKADSYAHLRVEDNGCGIPEEQIKYLFEPFFTTKGEGKGTGLGLAMVFGAIKTHHGYLEVESVAGKGSIFHIYIPLLEKKSVAFMTLEDETVVEGNGELILLVDDEVHVLEMGREVLESMGYRVLQAGNGVEAVEMFTAYQDEIALIITDLVMPKLGGVKAVDRIRKIQPDIKVIFSTGYDKHSTLPDAIPTGEIPILSKPYNIGELSKIIRQQLESS